MNPSFRWGVPTAIRFGLHAIEALPEVAPASGDGPVLIVTDRVIARLGLAGRVVELLAPRACEVFAAVEPNPTTRIVDAAAARAREKGASLVIGLGGGSSLDAAKTAALLAREPGNEIAPLLHGRTKPAGARLPLVAIPTTAGTGSEVTPISVLTDPDADEKRPLVHPSLYPAVALVDPELTRTMPAGVTASTGMDALSHAMEALWSTGANPISDALGLEAARLVLTHLAPACARADDLEARSGMSLGSLLAGLAFGHTKTAGVHALSFPLTHRFGVPHGSACAMGLAPFARLNRPAIEGKLARLARLLGEPDVEALLARLERLTRAIEIPGSLASLGVSREDWPALASETLAHPNAGNNPVPLDEITLTAILEEIA